MEETSLDDFCTPDRPTAADEGPSKSDETGGAGAVEPDTGGADTPAPADASASEGADAEQTDGPWITAAWSAAAETCAACCEGSAWRWAQSGEMVCPACKEW